MKTLDKGQDKIKKISEQLRLEVLEPAQKEAEKVLEEARQQAKEIIAKAEKEKEDLIMGTRKQIEQERNVFHSSLLQASSQAVESLRQEIENHLFNDQLRTLVSKETSDPRVIARIIEAILKAVEKEGLSVDISAIIPKAVSVQEVNRLLGEGTLKRLKENSVVLGDISGGAQVKLIDKNLTIDISDETLNEKLAQFVRKDFRKMLFG